MLAPGTLDVLLLLALQGSGADLHVEMPPAPQSRLTPKKERRFTLDLINDGFATIYDEGYSSGIRLLTRTGPWRQSWALAPLMGPLRDHLVAEYWTAGLAHEMWTPADLSADRLSLLADDRPYAGLLSVTGQVDMVLRGGLLDAGYSRLSLGLMTGVTGDWSGSASIQRKWHEGARVLTGQDYPKDPKGWDIYQIPETVLVGLTVGAEADVMRVSAPSAWSRLTGAPFGTRASALAECDLGTFRVGCTAGLTLRTGWMPEVTLNGGTPIMETAGPTHIPVSAHLHVSTKISVVGYDALLDGPLGTDGPTANKRQVRARFEVGTVLQLWAAEIIYTFVLETSELTPLPYWAQPMQRMGHIKLSYRW